MNVNIFLEGVTDENFINVLIPSLNIQNLAKPGFIIVDGYTNLPNIKNKFQENSDLEGINLVIFDADSPENKGGYQKRYNYLMRLKTELNIEFELFLFPNNSHDGDLETILENCTNVKHKRLFDCFEAYNRCISNFKNPDGSNEYSVPNRKSKIYAYLESQNLSGKRAKRLKDQDYMFELPEFWNLNSEYLDPLKQFLRQYLLQE